MKAPGAVMPPMPGDVESLRGRTDPAAVRAAAREFESVFAYELVKAMRATAGGPGAANGFGGDVYGTLFDMELAKLIAARGLGLQEMVLKGLEGRGMGTASGDAAAKDGTSAAADPDIRPAPPRSGGRAARPHVEAVPHTHDPSAAERAASLPGSSVRPTPEETPVPPEGSAPAGAPEPDVPGALFPIRRGGRQSSGFGYRKDPITGAVKFHHGIDIAATAGTSVYPAKGGEVTFSGYQKGYGNVVVVDHEDGFVTKYAHNRANRVAAGDRVGPDTVIAEVGSTGRSTGPHLHFEVRYEGKRVHPEAVFAGTPKGNG